MVSNISPLKNEIIAVINIKPQQISVGILLTSFVLTYGIQIVGINIIAVVIIRKADMHEKNFKGL